MSAPAKPGLFLCVSVKAWETMPPELKEIAERDDAPYERVICPLCTEPMLLTREGRAMLDSGQAESAICTDCLVARLGK